MSKPIQIRKQPLSSSVGWIQTTAKDFGEKVPHALIAIEVQEPALFEGDIIHLMDGQSVGRARRKVYATRDEAVAVYEDPRLR